MIPRLSGMYFSALFLLGLVSVSVASPTPSGNNGFRYEVGPSQPEPAPENFDIDLKYEQPKRGPYTVNLRPAGRPIGRRFVPAANVAKLQNFNMKVLSTPWVFTNYVALWDIFNQIVREREVKECSQCV